MIIQLSLTIRSTNQSKILTRVVSLPETPRIGEWIFGGLWNRKVENVIWILGEDGPTIQLDSINVKTSDFEKQLLYWQDVGFNS
jgi:hypothetical protein